MHQWLAFPRRISYFLHFLYVHFHGSYKLAENNLVVEGKGGVLNGPYFKQYCEEVQLSEYERIIRHTGQMEKGGS